MSNKTAGYLANRLFDLAFPRITNTLANRSSGFLFGVTVAKDKSKLLVYLEPSIKDDFKTACFDRHMNMSDVVAELVEDWIKANPPYLRQKVISQPKKGKGKGA